MSTQYLGELQTNRHKLGFASRFEITRRLRRLERNTSTVASSMTLPVYASSPQPRVDIGSVIYPRLHYASESLWAFHEVDFHMHSESKMGGFMLR